MKASDNQYQYYLQNKNYDAIIMGTICSLSPNLETYFNASNFNSGEIGTLLSEV